jgi:hypothetical protein
MGSLPIVEWIDGPRTRACEWDNCDGLAGYRVIEADGTVRLVCFEHAVLAHKRR